MTGWLECWCGDGALSSARPTDFALHGESLFLAWPRKSNQKEGHPHRQALRFAPGPLTPSPLQGPGPKGHPWPTGLSPHPCGSTPCAAIPFGLTKGEMGAVPTSAKSQTKSQEPKAFFRTDPEPAGNTPVPFRRPSAGVAEGDARQDAERVTKGQGRPFVTCPRSGAGAREPRRSRGRMTGRAFSLVTFSLRAQRESDSPCKAKPVASAEESASSWHQNPLPAPTEQPAASRKEGAPARPQSQGLTRSMHRS